MLSKDTAFVTLNDSIIPDVHHKVDIIRLPDTLDYMSGDVLQACLNTPEGQPPMYVINPKDVSKWVPFVRALHNNMIMELVSEQDMDAPSIGAMALVSKVAPSSLDGILLNHEVQDSSPSSDIFEAPADDNLES